MSENNAASHYVGDAGQRYHGQKRAIPAQALPWVAKLRAEKIAPHISTGDTVFEFGVGSGWNLAQLNCKRRIGFDVSTFLAPEVEQHGIEFISDLSQIEKNSADVALCHHALEHVKNPAHALEQIRDVLRPDGKLLLFVPYEKERRYQHFNPAEPNHHLFSWNVQTLGNLVSELGFEFIEGRLGRFGYDRFAAAWATRLKIGERGFRFLRAVIHLVKPAFEVRVVATKK